MTVSTGTRLGPYEVLAKLGEGGMGEVYKARDTRLNRSVAVKVLPPELASDPERRSRFEREAHAIAALSHPHICTIYDVGRENGTDYLVMELLEGETLADRLGRAKARPLTMSDVLRYATEIADALDKAHRAGIVHRDLKPANIMLTKSGAKLLDFGLAKLRGPAVAISMTAIEQATTTGGPKTASGTILGTVHYMSPEQVEGREADARSDIWALGVVIYEMATGTRPFDGASPASIIGAILKDSPAAISTCQPLAPASLDAAVAGCLEKDPDDRWQSASDVKRLLRSALSSTPEAAVQVTPSARRRISPLVIGSIAALLLMALAGGAAWRYGSMASTSTRADLVRFEIEPPPNVFLSPSPIASAAQVELSPDGRQLVFVAASKHGLSQLWVRPLDDVVARPLGGTEGASYPFWSPDSRFIGFFSNGKLKKVDVVGGSPQVLGDVSSGRGGTWNADGVIIFAGAAQSSMSKVSAVGGAITAATSFNRGEEVVAHYWPQFLSDGHHFLFYQRSAKSEHEGIYIGSLDSPATTKIDVETHARAVRASGYLFFIRDGMLLGQALDEVSGHVHGDPIRLGSNVGYFQSSYGYAAISAAGNVVAYGPTVAPTTTLRWQARTGSTIDSVSTGVYSGPRLSPDGQSLLVSARESGSKDADILVFDVAQRSRTRLTSDPLNDWFPAWSPDGRRVFFGSTREGSTRVFQKVGMAPEERLLDASDSVVAQYPNDVSSDGKTLLYMQSSNAGYDLGSTPLNGVHKFTPFAATRSNEVQGRFSPNGRWVAYASDKSGEFEVYVQSFSTQDNPKRISTAGGMQPEWRGDGQELFYISPSGKLMAVPVTTGGATLEAGPPHALFDVEVPEGIPPYPGGYAVRADGQRFLINSIADSSVRQPLTVILNWTTLLKK
jgi:eukaryotic-like serine/threonine-protein kinase